MAHLTVPIAILIIAAGALHAAWNAIYPIARGTSPLVVAVGAYLFAGERLGLIPLAGLVILAVGLMRLALSAGRVARSAGPGNDRIRGPHPGSHALAWPGTAASQPSRRPSRAGRPEGS